eukprot:9496653-Pyramimonas_sp.AAC.1
MFQVSSCFRSPFRVSCIRLPTWSSDIRIRMPLSSAQISVLKNGATPVQFMEENPHWQGSKAYERYERYKVASTTGEAGLYGAMFQDLS